MQSSPLLQGIVGGEGGGVGRVQAAGVSLVELGAAARLLEQGVGPGVDIRQRGVQLGVRVLFPVLRVVVSAISSYPDVICNGKDEEGYNICLL